MRKSVYMYGISALLALSASQALAYGGSNKCSCSASQSITYTWEDQLDGTYACYANGCSKNANCVAPTGTPTHTQVDASYCGH